MALRPSQLSSVPRELITEEYLRKLKREDLCEFLAEHCVSHSDKKKDELVDLCLRTARLSLPSKEQDDYISRNIERRTVNGITYPPPVTPEIVWSSNLYHLPSLDTFDVSHYLSTKCGWTKDRIQRRKQDNGFQLHSNGHIHDVQIAELRNDMVYVRAKCVPETRQSGDPYRLWILLDSTGQIYSAECSCVAGDGSCKHVVAAIFGLWSFSVELEDKRTESVTDVAAYWTKPKRVCRPVPVDDLDIRHDISVEAKVAPTAKSGYKTLPDNTNEKKIEKDIVKLLKDSKLKSVALYTLSDSESDTDVDVDDYPLNIIDLIFHKRCENVKKFVTNEYINNVNSATIGQADNSFWKYQRKGRLTASKFFDSLRYKGNNPNNSIVKNCLGLYRDFSSAATKYGLDNEPVARTKYVESMFSKHTSFKCEETGFHVYREYPYFGASPDGVVLCKCCGQGVLEIKCPITLKDLYAKEALTKLPSFHIVNGLPVIKKTEDSPYYIQMLGQMAICNVSYCDFVLYTQKDFYMERVEFNASLWNSVEIKLKTFYETFILPILLTSS